MPAALLRCIYHESYSELVIVIFMMRPIGAIAVFLVACSRGKMALSS